MNNFTARLVHYRRSLPHPIVTSHGRYLDREGLILLVRDRRGRLGMGDAAPLAGVSLDTLGDAETSLNSLASSDFRPCYGAKHALDEFPTSAQEYFAKQTDSFQTKRRYARFIEEWFTVSPHLGVTASQAAFFAAGSALGELKAKHEKLPLCRSLSEGDTAARIPINGLMTAVTVEDTRRQACRLDAAGFSTIKVKVGYDNPADDIVRIRTIHEVASTSLLRLDANGGWDESWATQVLSQIPLSPIDFIEQPFQRGMYHKSLSLAEKFGVRLALDEEIQSLNDAERLITKKACHALVLKPMVLGHLYGCHQIAMMAREVGIDVVYTSSWESDIGIAATLHLAAALGPSPPAMGLSTAGMISEGIVKTPLRIENGFLKVPEGPGLGIELAPELLAQLNQT